MGERRSGSDGWFETSAELIKQIDESGEGEDTDADESQEAGAERGLTRVTGLTRVMPDYGSNVSNSSSTISGMGNTGGSLSSKTSDSSGGRWIEAQADSGERYFYHTGTGETSFVDEISSEDRDEQSSTGNGSSPSMDNSSKDLA